MAMEVLGTVMTLQAQSAPKVGGSSRTESKESKEMSSDVSQVIDTNIKTPVVSATEGSSDSRQENQSESQREYDNEQLKEAVKQMCESVNRAEAVFGFHEDTNRMTIKIIDKDTKELIKEVPAEETLDMISKIWEMAGMLVDEKR